MCPLYSACLNSLGLLHLLVEWLGVPALQCVPEFPGSLAPRGGVVGCARSTVPEFPGSLAPRGGVVGCARSTVRA